jgi:hypothetical protein
MGFSGGSQTHLPKRTHSIGGRADEGAALSPLSWPRGADGAGAFVGGRTGLSPLAEGAGNGATGVGLGLSSTGFVGATGGDGFAVVAPCG